MQVQGVPGLGSSIGGRGGGGVWGGGERGGKICTDVGLSSY